VTDVLFVYGTLRGEFENPHARRLREHADFIGNSTMPGSVFQVGQCLGYQREPDGIVHGELYRLHDPETTLAALDDYEGEAYSRIIVNDAWIYAYTGPV
jgi:gamma-glutamylcyclotransferase (GGCT)/AIG2-like uncharacterized protein YtfP